MVFVYHDYRVRNLCKYSQASQEGTVRSVFARISLLLAQGTCAPPPFPSSLELSLRPSVLLCLRLCLVFAAPSLSDHNLSLLTSTARPKRALGRSPLLP